MAIERIERSRVNFDQDFIVGGRRLFNLFKPEPVFVIDDCFHQLWLRGWRTESSGKDVVRGRRGIAEVDQSFANEALRDYSANNRDQEKETRQAGELSWRFNLHIQRLCRWRRNGSTVIYR